MNQIFWLALVEQVHEVLTVPFADLTPLHAERLAHLRPEGGTVDQLNVAAALLFLPISQHPHICWNTGIVE